MSAENVAIVKSIYQALATGDVPTALGAMSADIEWHEAENFPYADGSPYHGPDAVLNGVFARLGSDWDGFSVDAREFLDAGETIVMTGRYNGTHKATGRAMNPWVAHIWTFEDGKAVQFQQLVDTLAVARATGSV